MFEKLKDKWQEILSFMQEEYGISPISYDTWLAKLEPYSLDSDVLDILVPDAMFLKFIKSRYSTYLQVAIEEVTQIKCTLEFVTKEDIAVLKKNGKAKVTQDLPSILEEKMRQAGINPRYTFDTFVEGKNNNLAKAASVAVAEAPGESYNPLFIYGGVGLGKTHLMHSIAHYILEHDPDAKVMYAQSEKFTNEVIDAIGNRGGSSPLKLRNKYRNIDVLLIDDIQFIIGKVSTQEEFFWTFNTLIESKKQVIISSDKPPKAFENLEERLRSRFQSGLMVDIQPPDYETRMAILQKKEENDKLNIDYEVLTYIATNIVSNIRELEGALTQVKAFSKLNNNAEINLELAKSALDGVIAQNAQNAITPELISRVVAEHFNLTQGDLVSQKKTRELVLPRQVVMYLCNKMTKTTYKTIGEFLGGRDHSTVMHGVAKISTDMETNETLRNTLDVLTKKINPAN
ncbi:MAG: chromosomal replication initiator protein DnaA [Lachnospiraceae bacterium]|jgi:chromosomal replication initiator protein|nr:chromosomal replication initiator protein DnaA [Lachnospiraceae bacterium]